MTRAVSSSDMAGALSGEGVGPKSGKAQRSYLEATSTQSANKYAVINLF